MWGAATTHVDQCGSTLTDTAMSLTVTGLVEDKQGCLRCVTQTSIQVVMLQFCQSQTDELIWLFSDPLELISRCFRVLEHRDLHVETETVQPGDICGFTGVGGWRHEVPFWCGWSHPVAGWVATYWPSLLSHCSYQGSPKAFVAAGDTELFWMASSCIKLLCWHL